MSDFGTIPMYSCKKINPLMGMVAQVFQFVQIKLQHDVIHQILKTPLIETTPISISNKQRTE